MTPLPARPAQPESPSQWLTVDEGWGRMARDFATLSEPGNCREYTGLHQLLNVRAGDRLLDIGCGSGLAIELASIRGARCAGIDASPRLVAIASDRSPAADLRVGDMGDLPWESGSFDVVTSFRAIWATTVDALAQARRVLVPGGRLGLTVWGHVKASPGAWALRPFTLAAPAKVANQADMNRLGRPGVGEQLLAEQGFTNVRRHELQFVWEFADPESYARAIASTGPAYEAIQAVGEVEFHRYAVQLAAEHTRDGLPLRAQINLVGFTARAPQRPVAHATYLGAATLSTAAERLLADDRQELGFVMNATRLWMHNPTAHDQLFHLLGELGSRAGLTRADRGVLVCAAASTIDDAYCSLAWGRRLAADAGDATAASVLTGGDDGLDARGRALARWARLVAGSAIDIQPDDVQTLREVGFDDGQILAVTMLVALRVAFSLTNNALGAHPDHELADLVPMPVREAVSYGRRPV